MTGCLTPKLQPFCETERIPNLEIMILRSLCQALNHPVYLGGGIEKIHIMYGKLGGGFKYFFMFTSTWGRCPI